MPKHSPLRCRRAQLSVVAPVEPAQDVPVHWRAICAGKRRYTHRHEADHAAKLALQRGWPGKTKSYRCPCCGDWHITTGKGVSPR